MSVTFEEIDKFVDRIMDESAGADYAARLGRKTWYLKHKLAENYGCPTCQPTFVMLEKGQHDAVNIQLGKPVHDPQNFLKAVAFYNEAAKKILGSGTHAKGISVHVTHEGHNHNGTKVSH
jgi:hypothetical protein